MDDLVKRLRDDPGLADCEEAADRIEALEARVAAQLAKMGGVRVQEAGWNALVSDGGVEAAVLAEREACAEIAENFFDRQPGGVIAAIIRDRSKGDQ